LAGARLVRLDSRGRLLLPREVREALGLREGSQLAVRVRSDGVIELVPVERLRERVAEAFRRRMKGWREEDHEATRLLEAMVGGDS
jgi:AbrB family looped-hinge helix DNA binding protein